MITADLPDYFGTVVFCDDIREEIGGKRSYIGIYKGFMGVHGNFPFALPKFFFAVSFWQHKQRPKLPLRLWIFLPGDADDKPSIEGEFSPDLVPTVSTPEPENSGLPLMEYECNEIVSAFAPLVISQPGLIKVRIVRGDVMHRLGTLSIIKLPTGENQRGTISAAPI